MGTTQIARLADRASLAICDSTYNAAELDVARIPRDGRVPGAGGHGAGLPGVKGPTRAVAASRQGRCRRWLFVGQDRTPQGAAQACRGPRRVRELYGDGARST